MSNRHRTETVVVGAGQAGLALSRHLTDAGQAHVVLERGRIGERWRSERWDSLTLLSPSWANRLPGQAAPVDPHGFIGRQELVDQFERYARSFDAPVVEGATVLSVRSSQDGYEVDTDRGRWAAQNVVLATGDCGVRFLPKAAAATPNDVASIHSSQYRSPDRLPPGAVLVVGAGPSGQQLALELARSGRDVTISVGRHARLPRRYRGRDIWEWLQRMGDFDVSIDELANPAAMLQSPSVAVTGANGGEPLDLGVLHDAGVDVRGRLAGFAGHHALFSDDLHAEVERAELRMRRILSRIDAQVALDRDGPPSENVPGLHLADPRPSVDLRAAGIGTVLWATGYRRAYPWLHVPVLDEQGEIVQHHGVTAAPGLYTLGLRFQRRRGSHFIGGVGADAKWLAERIVATERSAAVPKAA